MVFRMPNEPLKEYMVENGLTSTQCDMILQACKEACQSKDTKKYLQESDVALFAGMTVAAIIAMMMAYIKNKYSINVQKILDQTKELNDIYAKVDDMLKNDKMARFKHRNDKVNATTKTAVLKDTKDPRKMYKITPDLLAYNSEYFINEIDKIMEYVNNVSNDKKHDFQGMYDSLMKDVEDVYHSYEYISHTKPVLLCKDYKNQRFETVLMVYKEDIANIYSNTAYMNQLVQTQMQYLQLCNQAYNKMIAKYGKDKYGKKLVDDIFKKMLYYSTLAIDFNNAINETLVEQIRYYVSELEKIYEIVRS